MASRTHAATPRGVKGGVRAAPEARGGAIAGYIPAIDGIRAIAVLAVLIYHLDPALIPGGFTGVDVFFVISGFVVTKSILEIRAETLPGFLAQFYRRRLLRIVPALALFLCVMALLTTMFIPTLRMLSVNDVVGLSAFLGLSNVAIFMTEGNYFSPTAEYNPFTHTWSLAVEEQFYVVFPFFVFAVFFSGLAPHLRAQGIKITALVCAASLALAAYFTAADLSFAFYMLPTRLWELGAGALLFLVLTADGASLPPRARAAVGAGLGLAAAGGLVLSLGFADARAFPFPWALAPVATAAALIGAVILAPRSALPRLLATPPFVFFGKISYSLYLWHFGIIALFRWTVGIDGVELQILAAALSVLMATASTRLIEAPIRFSPALARRSDRTVIAGVLAGAALAMGFAGLVFLARPYLSLTAAADAAIWSPRGANLLIHQGCEVRRARESAPGGGDVTRFVPRGCGEAATARRLALIGDSHAGAYETLLQHVAAREGVEVAIYQRPGCQPFRFREATAAPACERFRDATLAALGASLGAGDILFSAGLRMPRFREFGETTVRENAELDLAPTPGDLEEAAQSFERLAPLLDAGVRVIVEAPKPVFRTAPLRCADWFNRGSAYCAPGFETSRAEIEARRLRVVTAMAAFAARDPGISVWDPTPLLCPEATCSAFRDGKPLFTDGDHLTRTANLLLLPAFTEHLRALP